MRPAKAKVEDAERAHLQSFVDRFRAKASKAAQAQSRLKHDRQAAAGLGRDEERVAPFTLPSPREAAAAAPVAAGKRRQSSGYEPGEPILKRLDLRLDLDDRIGLLGVNGAGKSTFAKLIAGALTTCRVRRHCTATAA